MGSQERRAFAVRVALEGESYELSPVFLELTASWLLTGQRYALARNEAPWKTHRVYRMSTSTCR